LDNYLLKEKLRNEEQVIGGFISIYNTSIVEMMGYAGFDFIVIDNEHGAFSEREIAELIKISKYVGVAPIVRTINSEGTIQKCMDSGAHGIQIPMVNTAEEARSVIERAKFPPIGFRGVSYSIPAAKYGHLKGREYLDYVNENISIAVQIETQEAVNNIEKIVQVEGIDIIFVGTTDLAVNLGVDDANSPEINKIVDSLFETTKKYGKKFGLVTPDVHSTKTAISKGIDYNAGVINTIINNAFSEVTSLKYKNE
jgi:4-hydroxy-2-oxoheptanedioate aldolase